VRTVRLGDVAEVTMGQSPPGDTYNRDCVGLPLLNGPTEFGHTHPEPSLYTTSPRATCSQGDLIFCVRGSTGRMNWADQVYALGRGVAGIRGRTRVETRHVRYCLELDMQALLLRTGGSTMSNLRKSDIESFEIPFPDGRHVAVAILSTLDDLIESSMDRTEILEETAQAIYREWFVNFRFPGHGAVKLVESKLGPIPEGWQVSNLGDVATIVMGQSPRSVFYNDTGEGLPFHQGVSSFGSRFPMHGRFCTELLRVAENGDVLFSVRAPVGRMNLADRPLVLGRGLAAIRSPRLGQPFLFHQMKVLFFEDDLMGGGTVFKAVTRRDMDRIGILLPPGALVAAFNDLVGRTFSMVSTFTGLIEVLRKMRGLLLPRLVSGDIDVSDLAVENPEEVD
jgi:type I restriction enzyme S subunit